MNSVIVCQKCLGTLERNENNVSCISCGGVFRVEGGKYYFTDIKDSIIPTIKPGAANSETWGEWRSANFDFLKEALAGLEDNSVVLDLGAGSGHFVELFKNCNYIAADFYNYDIVTVVTDITKRLPFLSDSFDYVVLSNVLEHISEPKQVIEECHRVLKKGGKILITVPLIVRVHQEPYDFLRYTHFMLEYLLNKGGFSGIRVTNIGTIVEIQRVITSGYFQTAQDNLIKLIPNRYARLVPMFTLRMSKILIRRIFLFIDRFLNKPHLIDSGKDGYIQGYGVVAEK